MKRIVCQALLFLFLFSSCTTPEVGETYTPEPTPSLAAEATHIPEPTAPEPEETPFPSYEDYFSRRIEYMDTTVNEPYFAPVEDSFYAKTPDAIPIIALVRELVEDTLGWIPQTLAHTPDGLLYVFWAGTGEGAALYRLYYPTKTLDCLYSLTAEEVEDQYYYTVQTEATAVLLPGHQKVGERVCLMGYVEIYSNQEFLWGSYNPEFLALFDYAVAHQEDYPQYEWDMGYDEFAAAWVESENKTAWRRCHYFSAYTGEYQTRGDQIYGGHDYWWITES